MKKFLQKKLDGKTDHQKKQLANIFAGILTGIIVVLWVLALVFLKENKNEGLITQSEQNMFDNFVQDLSARSSELGKTFEQQQNYFKKQKDEFLEMGKQLEKLEAQNIQNSAKEFQNNDNESNL